MDIPEVGETADTLPPHLLNDVNKELTNQMKAYEAEIEARQREVEDNKSRVSFMLDHLKNVKQEISNTQILFDAKRREIETEDHMAQIADREVGRVRQEMTRFLREQDDLQERVDAIQNAIFHGNVKMDEFKASMNFQQEELEQWDLARKQKEDDAVALQRYSKEDGSKVKELNLQIEKLSHAVQDKKKDLEGEITETQAAQIELDKTADDFKNLHRERQQLVQQWEDAVHAMHNRDEVITAARERFSEGKRWLTKRNDQLKERAAFLSVEQQNNKEIDNKILQEERVLSKYRTDHLLISQHLAELDDELDVMKNTLNKALGDLNTRKQMHGGKSTQLEKRQKDYDRMMKSQEKSMARLEAEYESAKDMEKQNKLVHDLLMQTIRSLKQLDAEVQQIKDEQYHKSQDLFAVRKTQAGYLAEISGAQSQNKNLLAKINQLDQESFKQQELLYNVEFQVQQMERKVNRAKGERTEEERRELKEKISMLQTMLDDLLKQHKILDLQVKRVSDDLRQAKVDLGNKDKEERSVTEVILELTLENESCQAEFNSLLKRKESLMVQADVLQLQVSRLKGLMDLRGSEVLGLENRKSQLEVTIEERETEIRVHKEILGMEAKTGEEERKQLATELRERQSKVGHLKNRFEVLISRIGKEEDQEVSANDTESTHAQFVVRAAKERELLQAKGDTLDDEIKRVEKEARKMDKTIAVLKGCNVQFKTQFKRVGDDDVESATKTALEQKNREVQSLVNRRANDIKDFLKTEMAKLQEFNDKQRAREELTSKLHVLREAKDGVDREIDDCKEATARIETQASKAKRDLKRSDEDSVEHVTLSEEEEHCAQMIKYFLHYSQQNDGSFDHALRSTLSKFNLLGSNDDDPAV
ncbi:Coiled-coil domain-containing protein 39 [Diplonema papillatum]|nr:Coiled-coil domain-containing protein 39 [Diplonema papillatum]KAJ9453851.1 Coiled-coil domain-containing protein 39 [Diplonema papillatum]